MASSDFNLNTQIYRNKGTVGYGNSLDIPINSGKQFVLILIGYSASTGMIFGRCISTGEVNLTSFKTDASAQFYEVTSPANNTIRVTNTTAGSGNIVVYLMILN